MERSGIITAMSGCVLRVSGARFEVDTFLGRSGIAAFKVWRLGEPSLLGRKTTTTSGFNALVSEAGDLPTQTATALAFLQEHRDDLLRLARTVEVDDLQLDFGLPQLNVAAQFVRLPEELVRSAAEFRMSFELSL